MRKWYLIKVKRNELKKAIFQVLFGFQAWRGDDLRRFVKFTASLGQVTSHHIFLQSLQGPGPLTQSTRQYFILMQYLQLLDSFVHVCLECYLYSAPFPRLLIVERNCSIYSKNNTQCVYIMGFFFLFFYSVCVRKVSQMCVFGRCCFILSIPVFMSEAGILTDEQARSRNLSERGHGGWKNLVCCYIRAS